MSFYHDQTLFNTIFFKNICFFLSSSFVIFSWVYSFLDGLSPTLFNVRLNLFGFEDLFVIENK